MMLKLIMSLALIAGLASCNTAPRYDHALNQQEALRAVGINHLTETQKRGMARLNELEHRSRSACHHHHHRR